ncbi:MAG: helix-turn-helix transcriptional regulator [Christensenellaceae bacterium]|jgi:transcriptional regulator, araC family|nr:helix-turn-helix transcriptional regulator [Christensenellaceae bacterium]
MAEKISMPALEGLILHFMAGGLSQCPDWWGEENISVCYNKLYYIVDGECYIKINQQEFIAHPGQIFFLPSGSKQTYYNISNNHVQKYWFHFSALDGDRDVFRDIPLPCCINVSVQDKEKVMENFKAVSLRDGAKDIVDILIQNYAMMDILAYYIDKSHLCGIKAAPDELINAVINYIDNNLDSELTPETLSGLVHFHPSYFSRYFKKKLGMPPHEYIKKRRIEKAQYLLESGSMLINEIAACVGLHDMSYFSKLFKKYTGMTPSYYRFTTTPLAVTVKNGLESRYNGGQNGKQD